MYKSQVLSWAMWSLSSSMSSVLFLISNTVTTRTLALIVKIKNISITTKIFSVVLYSHIHFPSTSAPPHPLAIGNMFYILTTLSFQGHYMSEIILSVTFWDWHIFPLAQFSGDLSSFLRVSIICSFLSLSNKHSLFNHSNIEGHLHCSQFPTIKVAINIHACFCVNICFSFSGVNTQRTIAVNAVSGPLCLWQVSQFPARPPVIHIFSAQFPGPWGSYLVWLLCTFQSLVCFTYNIQGF